MTEQTSTPSTPSTPEKSKISLKKKIFIVIAFVLGALGIDHYTFNYVSGGVNVEVTLTDSTITTTANIDTTLTLVKADEDSTGVVADTIIAE